MKYIDLFAGIGGFAQAAKAYNMKCVFASEIDKYARITYEANHGHVPAGDITKIHAADIPDHDLLMAGFPCQAFSVAGKRLGFEDTRGTLFFEIARILKHKQPAMFLLENVKGLKSHDQGRTLQTILDTLEGLGYQVHWKILNAKDYGVPQNRERIFFVGFLEPREFIWPEKQAKVTLSQVLEGNFEREIGYTVRASGRGSGLGDKHNWDTYILSDKAVTRMNRWAQDKTTSTCVLSPNADYTPTLRSTYYKDCTKITIADYTLSDALWQGHQRRKQEHEQKGNGFGYNLVTQQDTSATLSARYGKDGSEILVAQPHMNPRKLTPRECARLQGFPDNFVIPVSNSQAYKQFGNAVCVKVVEAILKQMLV